MSIDSISTNPLDIGEVLGDTFAVIGRALVVLANLAMLFVGVPAAVILAGAALAPVSPVFGILILIGGFAALVGVLLGDAAIFLVAMAVLHGQPVPAASLISLAAKKFWPMFCLAILLALGAMIGSVLLVVPGIILALAGSVALPAQVLENRGIFESFRRSAALTRGKRWSIFLLFFIVGLVLFIAELLLIALFGQFQAFVFRQPSLSNLVLLLLLVVVAAPFKAVMLTALFNKLRGEESHGAGTVAEVFA